MKTLGGIDASFLYMETPQTPMHVAGFSIVELPPGFKGNFYELYKRHIRARLHLFPVLMKKVVPVPWDIDHPIWVDDDELDLDYHIRHLGLPEPGTMEQLEDLVGRLHSNFLDRSRPLWEFYVIDGLASGQVAIYTKIHHAGMDGATSQKLITTMYDATPEVHEVAAPERHRAVGDKFGLAQILRGVGGHIARQEIRALQYVPEALKAAARLILPDAETLSYGRPVLPQLITPHTLFN